MICFKKSGFFDGEFQDDDDNIPLNQLMENAEQNFLSLKLVNGIDEEFNDFLDCDYNAACDSMMTIVISMTIYVS